MSTGSMPAVWEILAAILVSGIFSFVMVTVLRGICMVICHAVEWIMDRWFWR